MVLPEIFFHMKKTLSLDSFPDQTNPYPNNGHEYLKYKIKYAAGTHIKV